MRTIIFRSGSRSSISRSVISFPIAWTSADGKLDWKKSKSSGEHPRPDCGRCSLSNRYRVCDFEHASSLLLRRACVRRIDHRRLRSSARILR